MRKLQLEFNLQKAICSYISYQYPDVLFLSDTVASVKLTIPQANRNSQIQKKGFKCPDLLILEPNKFYSGLFLELKKDTPYKKTGEIKASQNDHLKEQLKYLEILNKKGYYTDFVWDFEKAKNKIDYYLSQK